MKRPIFLFFILFTLLNFAFTVLRSARTTLAVTDLGGSASFIPWYEILGTLPAAFFLSWFITFLMRKLSLASVFYQLLIGFNLFFFTYFFIIYPFWKIHILSWIQSENLFVFISAYVPIGLFFAAAELWKIGLISILLWGLANQYFSLEDAKKFYPPLMLGSSLGSFFGGIAISHTQDKIPHGILKLAIDSWHATLIYHVLIISLLSLVMIIIFFYLNKLMNHPVNSFSKFETNFSNNLKNAWFNPAIRSLAGIVLLDYLVYTIFEVIFLDLLKMRYPVSMDYFEIMGLLSSSSSVLTTLAALLVGPWLARRYQWKTLALATPMGALLTASPFFLFAFVLNFQNDSVYLDLALAFGCLCYCLGRATKYALGDTSKEMTYIFLGEKLRLQAKIVIEGLGSRFGKALASFSVIGVVATSGSVIASAPICLLIFLSGNWFWIKSVGVIEKEMKDKVSL